jgi:hypothetical protein
MLPQYHRQLVLDALSDKFSAKAMQVIIRGNLSQDLPSGQIGHPEYHFDDSQIAAGNTYIQQCSKIALDALINQNDLETCWLNFGKLTHAAQDFYAHTNYIRLWCEQLTDKHRPPTMDEILLPEILNHPDLISGRFYAPWEWITFLPWIGPKIGMLFPKDSHAYLNNDSPASRYFDQVYPAAVFRTIYEYNQFIGQLNQPGLESVFRDR